MFYDRINSDRTNPLLAELVEKYKLNRQFAIIEIPDDAQVVVKTRYSHDYGDALWEYAFDRRYMWNAE